MHWRVFIEVAAGLTLPAKAVTTGNVAATVEPRAIRSWLMAALLWSRRPNAVESGWSKELKEHRYGAMSMHGGTSGAAWWEVGCGSGDVRPCVRSLRV